MLGHNHAESCRALLQIGAGTVAMDRPIRHTGRIFLWALVVFGAAFGLVYVEKFAEYQHMPAWLIIGTRFISVCLFVFDGIVLLGTVAIAAIKVIKLLIDELRR
jgi:hypothetical protein